MGAAARQRGDRRIRQQLDDEARPVEFQIMERLNALAKYPDAGTPRTPVRIERDHHQHWWIVCPKTGFGYCYPTLNELVRRWHIAITGYDATTNRFTAIPSRDHALKQQCDAALAARLNPGEPHAPHS